MRIISRYLFREIFHFFWLFLCFFTVALLVYELYDERGEFLEHEAGLVDVVFYLIFTVPLKLAEVFPLIGLLSTIFAYGMLAKNREILAMVAAGVSYATLALPALIFGLGLTVFTFFFNEEIVPRSEKHAEHLIKVVIAGESETRRARRKNLIVKGRNNSFYAMERYYSLDRRMEFPTIFLVSEDGSHILERIDAETGRFAQSEGDNEVVCEFQGAERWTFDDGGTQRSYDAIHVPYRIPMEKKLPEFLSRSKDPEEMNYQELSQYTRLLEEKGGEKVAEYGTSLHKKLAFPVACALMVLLGFGVASDMHARRFSRGVSLGLLVAIGFYVLSGFFVNLGNEGALTPVAAGWVPVVVFTLVVYLLITRLKYVRG